MLRCTARLLKVADPSHPDAAAVPPGEDDWYVNPLWVDGHKCLLATHASTLFSIVIPDVRVGQLRDPGRLIVPRIVDELAVEAFPPTLSAGLTRRVWSSARPPAARSLAA